MRRTLVVRTLLVAAAVGVVLATVAFFTLDKTVTLAVDGEEREVRSFSRTVGSLLASEGLTAGERDLVTPSLDTSLSEGSTVVLRYGRPVTLTVDGETREVWTTARTVDDALAEMGVRSEGAYLSASRSRSIGREGLELDLRTPKELTVAVDGQQLPVTTTAPDLATALTRAGIVLGERDTVDADLAAAPSDAQVVTVTRISVSEVVESHPVPFAVDRRDDPNLLVGSTKVAQQGAEGAKDVVIEETRTNGEVTARTVLRESLVREPVTQVVQVGTQPKPAPAPRAASGGSSGAPAGGSAAAAAPSGSSGGLNWAALAQCESGGNASIVSATGKYHGLYQFSVATWQSVGGSGLPSQASAAEQTNRAQMLYDKAGAGQWPSCGPRLFS